MKVESRGRRLFMLQFIAALLVLAAPRSLHAHGHLRAATPAPGATLAAAPPEIRLTFSEAPELAETTVSLLAENGEEVRLGPLAAASALTVAARVPGTLPAGAYRVVWHMVAADGHPTHGEYRFTVQATSAAPAHGGSANAVTAGGAPSAGAAAAPMVRLASGHLPGHDTGLEASSPPFVALRFLLYVALITIIGVVAFRLLVLGRLAAQRRAPTAGALVVQAAAASARIGALLAGALVVVEAARLLAQSAALNSPGAALDPARLVTLVGHTHWGATWLLQLVAAVLALVGFQLAGRGDGRRKAEATASPQATAAFARAGWVLATLGALGLAFGTALGGHARVSALPVLAVVADTLHITGASGWLGSLAATMAAGVVVALRGPAHERARAVAALVDAFSPMALVFAGLTAATGLFAAWLQVGRLPALTGTVYGRVFLLKLALVAALGLVGAYNWLRLKPTLATDMASARLRRSTTLELAIGLAVVLVTAILVGLPTPVGM